MATNQGFKSFIPHPDTLDAKYLYWWLRTKRVYLKNLGNGATFKEVSKPIVSRIEIPLPSLTEQRRIAEILDRAGDIRAKRRAAIAQVDSVTHSIFLDLFGDPVINPKQFQKKNLGQLLRVRSGESVLVSELSDSGEFPVYGGNGINGYHNRFMFESPVIVIGRVGVYCGVVHVTNPKAWVTDNALFVTDFSSDLEFCYLAEALKIANLNQYAGRMAQPLVSGSRIYPVEILVPSKPLQREFRRRVEVVEKLKKMQRTSLAELDNLFASLQHRAFRGEL
jgi:type I restriction enzyme S subunit